MYQLDTNGRDNELLRCIKNYVANTNTIRRLSTVDVTELSNPSDYVNILRDNFVQIREIASRNRQILDFVLHPLLDSDEELTAEEIEALYAFKDILLNAYSIENLDLSLSYALVNRMFRDAKKKNDINYLISQLDAQIEIYYTLCAYTGRVSCDDSLPREYVKRAMSSFDTFKELIERERFAALGSEESRATVMTNVRYMSAIFEGILCDEEINKIIVDQYNEVLTIMNDPFYRELLPEFDWKYSEARVLEYYSAMTECFNRRGFNKDQILLSKKYSEILMDKWTNDPDYYSKLINGAEIELAVARNRYLCGVNSFEKYKRQLEYIYTLRDSESYSIDSIIINLLVPCEILSLLKGNKLSLKDENYLLQMYHNVISYAHHCSNANVLTTFLNYYMLILENFIEVSEEFTFETMCLESFAALHPPTYIHSLMVARFARIISTRMLDSKPELFIGVCDTETVEEVNARKKEIVGKVYHAALVHDIGKLSMIDTVFIYGRKLTDDEFKIISMHPDMGYKLADGTSLDEYKYIIRAHHRYHDDSAGYPQECEILPGCDKIIVDIVTVADCLDAATDSVGRSYAHSKTFEEFHEELKAGCGMRYGAEVVEIFKDDDLRKNLRYLLNEGRNQTYSEAYHLLVGVSAKGHSTSSGITPETELRTFLKKVADLNTTIGILNYDMSTVAPANGQEAIADAYTEISMRLNSLLTGQDTEALFRRMEQHDFKDVALSISLRRLRREIIEKRRIPEEFYEKYVNSTALGDIAWHNAYEAGDYSILMDKLEKVIDYTKKYYWYAYPDRDIYETLIGIYEEGMSLNNLTCIFAELKAGIKDIRQYALEHRAPYKQLKGQFPKEEQKKVCEFLLDYIGFDKESGVLGETAHPYTTKISFKDVRITNNYDETNPISAIFSTIHQGGHAIFEQNIREEFRNTSLGGLEFMGLHESQARLYEDMLGRNINFWKPIYGRIQEMLPALKDTSLEEFYDMITAVNPSPIRLDADELSYPLHIIMRYELELQIFEDDLTVKELPEAWRKKSKELLDIEPPNDRLGVLQDMHWANGYFGYFPSYLLGSVYAAMIYKVIERELGDVDTILAEGRIMEITQWLKDNLDHYGSLYNPTELYEKVCGKTVNAQDLLDYLENKYMK